jgi:uncharacterized protein (TIGR03435 family)
MLVASIADGMIVASVVKAQETAATFDAVSIKPNTSGDLRGADVLYFPVGRAVGTKVTARRIVLQAYQLTDGQLSGGPDWFDSDRFDLEAKTGKPASVPQLRQMLQSTLADRFKLVVRHEVKVMPVYLLTVGKNGPKSKLLELKPGETAPRLAPPPPGVVGNLVYRGNMQSFAETTLSLGDPSRLIGRPVLDKTGLKGEYLFAVPWAEGEDFMTAVEDQLGLKFESQKAPIDTVIVEHIEKPSEN